MCHRNDAKRNDTSQNLHLSHNLISLSNRDKIQPILNEVPHFWSLIAASAGFDHENGLIVPIRVQKMQNELKINIVAWLQIVVLCIFSSIIYGIAHDLITAHFAVEYFTVYHPKVIESESPLAMAFLWGVIATWWMGAFFGTVIATVSRVGDNPTLGWRALCKPLAVVLGTCWGLSMSLGVATYIYLRYSQGGLAGANEYERRLSTVGVIHGASYLLTAAAGIGLSVWVTQKRTKLSHAHE